MFGFGFLLLFELSQPNLFRCSTLASLSALSLRSCSRCEYNLGYCSLPPKMAMGKYSRVDAKKSLNWCSTTSIVVFVAFCLVGVWMLMSSAVPIQTQTLSTEENLTDKSSKQYEDSSGGLSESITREVDNGSDSQSETNIENTQNVSQEESVNRSEEQEAVSKEVSEEKVESESENGDQGNQIESSDEKTETEEEPKTENEGDGDSKVNDQV